MNANLGPQVPTDILELRAAEESRDAMSRELKGEEPILLPDATSGGAGGSEIEANIAAQKKTLEELMRRYTDKHPDVIATRNLIQELEAQKRQQVDTASKAARESPSKAVSNNPVYQQLKVSLAEQESLVASLRGRLSELQSRLVAMRDSASKVPQVEAEMTQMNRDYDVMRRIVACYHPNGGFLAGICGEYGAVLYEKPPSAVKCEYVWRRTNRWINPGVVIAAGLGVVALLWILATTAATTAAIDTGATARCKFTCHAKLVTTSPTAAGRRTSPPWNKQCSSVSAEIWA